MTDTQSVIGIIFNFNRTKVLLLKRHDIPIWVLPGGGVEKGETLEEAIIREIKEETGYISRIRKKIGEYTPVHWLTTSTHLYECSVLEGSLTTGNETRAIQFFPIDALPRLTPPPFINWIAEAVNHRDTLIQRPLTELNNWVVLQYLLQHPIVIAKFLWNRFRQI